MYSGFETLFVPFEITDFGAFRRELVPLSGEIEDFLGSIYGVKAITWLLQ